MNSCCFFFPSSTPTDCRHLLPLSLSLKEKGEHKVRDYLSKTISKGNMVHSRSESNLNRIFGDLSTLPDMSQKHEQEKCHSTSLSVLQPIKSSSCSNIPRDNPIESITLQTPSTAVPLVPIESTGFVVQSTIATAEQSLKLLDTWTINQSKTSTDEKKNMHDQTVPLSAKPSEDWKEQDFANRLRNRLKSREHLRKFFLS